MLLFKLNTSSSSIDSLSANSKIWRAVQILSLPGLKLFSFFFRFLNLPFNKLTIYIADTSALSKSFFFPISPYLSKFEN